MPPIPPFERPPRAPAYNNASLWVQTKDARSLRYWARKLRVPEAVLVRTIRHVGAFGPDIANALRRDGAAETRMEPVPRRGD